MKYDIFDWIVFVFFLTHIPITICIDAQAVVPSEFYVAPLRDLISWYVKTLKDPLFEEVARGDPAVGWFKAIVAVELIAQLPFFFVALIGWRKNWIRIPSIIYGTHTATTLIPILGAFLTVPSLLPIERLILCGIYLPYLIMPTLIAWRAASRPELFVIPDSEKKKRG